ncbi:hypothetical protein PTSG_06689 [Salpingoeca rosetta]|uniref:Bulb-type lectin domain-containing protein n=1 Tax=Salpingoeca rosetta (strain ATCC 50818 / BSB-021) TaxID=946362 RepID=F2UFQ4_SALR5|nr:uncharacterized protein PTSG_06689 [Salpingoeca rosetta]EGD75622.1 hypothetical protein PTSG_06689 [Salpingoeca rosetta]|eukprot:XP_004992079.1 hypothetical protein PTSG_06689 [Salpingoeca rosetta]
MAMTLEDVGDGAGPDRGSGGNGRTRRRYSPGSSPRTPRRTINFQSVQVSPPGSTLVTESVVDDADHDGRASRDHGDSHRPNRRRTTHRNHSSDDESDTDSDTSIDRPPSTHLPMSPSRARTPVQALKPIGSLMTPLNPTSDTTTSAAPSTIRSPASRTSTKQRAAFSSSSSSSSSTAKVTRISDTVLGNNLMEFDMEGGQRRQQPAQPACIAECKPWHALVAFLLLLLAVCGTVVPVMLYSSGGSDGGSGGDSSGSSGGSNTPSPPPPSPPMFATNLTWSTAIAFAVELRPASANTTAASIVLPASAGSAAIVVGSTTGVIGAGAGPSAGGSDAFACRISTGSGAVQWCVQFGSAGDDDARAVAATADGLLVYVGGVAGGSMLGKAGSGEADLFVVCLQGSDGAVSWTRLIGTSRADAFGGLVLDRDGDVFITGHLSSTQGSPTSTTTDELYVARLAGGTGMVQWQTRIGSSGDTHGRAIAVDASSGNIYITGDTTAVTAFNDDDGSTSLTDAFVVCLKGFDGSVVWRRQIDTGDQDIGHAVAVGEQGLLYVTGETAGVAAAAEDATAQTDVLVLCLRTTDGRVLWTTQLGSSSGRDVGYSAAVDGNGLVYIGGRAGGDVTRVVDSSTLDDGDDDDGGGGGGGGGDATGGSGDVASNGGHGFVARVSGDSGQFLGSKKVLEAHGSSAAYGVAVSSDGFLFVVGQADTTSSSSTAAFMLSLQQT